MLREKISALSEAGVISDVTLQGVANKNPKAQIHTEGDHTRFLNEEIGPNGEILYVDPTTEEFYY